VGRSIRRFILLLPLLSILLPACGDTPGDDDAPSPTPLPGSDSTGPTVVFDPIPDGQPAGEPVTLSVQLSDESGVYSAALYYRATGSEYWGTSFLIPGTSGYTGTIPGSYVTQAGVDYYVKATDASLLRNTTLVPADGASGALHFSTQLVTSPFPFLATFDPPEGTPEEVVANWSLEDTGWTRYIAGFNDQKSWRLRDEAPHSGTWAAFHSNGSPSQVDDFADYLISPPIDLSDATGVDLTWWERVDYPADARHSLLVSIGSGDPADGVFVPVIDPLPPADGADEGWVRSRHIDLSAWSGEPQVFIAFLYEGKFGDEWSLDDVRLETPSPDLAFGEVAVEPAQVEPGGSTGVVFPYQNEGLEATGPLTARLEGQGLQITPASLSLPAADAGEPGSAGPFTVGVDPGFPDNTFAAMTLTLSDGAHTWTQSARLAVGKPPVAHIEITHPYEDDIQLFIGYGDPAAPAWSMVVQQDEGKDAAGTFSWDVDLSAHMDALPPDAGVNRWYVQVWDDSEGNAGTLDVFRISMGDQVWESGGLPQPIPDNGTSIYDFIPGRASFRLQGSSTTPETIAPGQTVSLTVTVENTSAPPAGPLTGTLSTIEPDVVSLSGGPVEFTYLTTEEPIDGVFGTAGQDAPFRFTVSSRHVSSSPLAFTLTLTDGVDRWEVPVSLPVPYPVLGGLGVSIEDPKPDGSAGNEALDPGESAGLRIRVRNGGDLATFGEVSASVKVVSDDGAGATVDPKAVTLYDDALSAVLEPGEGGKGALLPIAVKGGKIGDRIQLEVTVTDGTLTRVEDRTLTLGDPPWNPLLVADDPIGDAPGTSDLAGGMFWRKGSLLKIRWTTYYTFDMSQTSLYSFLSNTPDFQYALVVITGQLLFDRWVPGDPGTWSKSYSPAPTTHYVTQVDARTVELGIDLAEINFASSPLYGGAGAGSCGGTTQCDYAPDEAVTTHGLTRFWW
jgi:hypothetical protein